jgi:hypothetical protein
MSTVPSVLHVGPNEITNFAGIFATTGYQVQVTSAANAGQTINTLSLDFRFYIGAQAMGQAVLNGVINHAIQSDKTTVTGGATVPATGVTGGIPALYAMSYTNAAGELSVVITNKSATAHQVTIRVNGAPVGLSVPFARTAYPTTFRETGLPSGTAWSVTAASTTATSLTDSIVLDLPNGTTSYLARSVLPYGMGGGNVVIAGGPGSAALTFAPVRFPVTFTESHLSTSTNWSVTIAGVTVHSKSTTVEFNLTNGTYEYEIGAPTSYAPLAGDGAITVNGAAAAASVNFSAVAHAVKFTESGLPAGTSWTT